MNVSEIGTSWSELRENFSSRDHGQGIIVSDKGEIATYVAEGQETIGKDGKLLSHGIMFFNSSSSGGLARLSNALGVYASQSDTNGTILTKVWELK